MAGTDAGVGAGRGEGWVIAQFPLARLAYLAPRLGPEWPRSLVWFGRATGFPLLAAGTYLFARGLLDLGASFTALPKPKEHARLVREGAYRIVRHPIYAGATLATL